MKNKKLIIIIAISLLLVLGIGVTYAWFSTSVIGEGNTQIVETGTLELIYTDGPEINLDNVYPGDTIEKTFSVENTGTLDTAYTINFTKLINTISNDELVYTLECTSGSCEDLDESVITESEIESIQAIKENIGISSGEKHE